MLVAVACASMCGCSPGTRRSPPRNASSAGGGGGPTRTRFDASRPGNDVPVTGQDLRAALVVLLEDRPVPAEQAPSIGCYIKWRPGNEPEYFGA